MNPGILTSGHAPPPMPYGLLGSPSVSQLPDQCWHTEAATWRRRVISNGGTVSQQTMAAVDQFCRAIDSAGLRDRFLRLNLFCGTGLEAALVPLYIGERIGISRGNATDTNNNFVAVDYRERGLSAGLIGNGSTKFLGTGLPGNSIRAPNAHFGVGLLATDTSNGSFKTMLGAANTSDTTAYNLDARNAARRCATMGSYLVANQAFGDAVAPFATDPLAIGRIIAAWPLMYRNGTPSGAAAAASSAFGGGQSYAVFADQYASSVGEHTNSRLGWYSIGLGMGRDQVRTFDLAIQRFETAMQRT